MALICIFNIHIFTDMGSAGMLFCCSSNCALILSNLKGNLSVILRDGMTKVVFVCVCVHTNQRKHSVSKNCLSFPFNDRVTLSSFFNVL